MDREKQRRDAANKRLARKLIGTERQAAQAVEEERQSQKTQKEKK